MISLLSIKHCGLYWKVGIKTPLQSLLFMPTRIPPCQNIRAGSQLRHLESQLLSNPATVWQVIQSIDQKSFCPFKHTLFNLIQLVYPVIPNMPSAKNRRRTATPLYATILPSFC